MTKAELIEQNVALQNRIDYLKSLLPGVKTDKYIKNFRNKIEPFKFSYTVPSLDWYSTINVEIKYDDYYYFALQKRFGPSWWLVGKNPYENPYRWEGKEIGHLSSKDLIRFIKWTKQLSQHGNPIIEINVISGSFDIFECVKEVLEYIKNDEEV